MFYKEDFNYIFYLNKLLNIYLDEWKDNYYFKNYVIKKSNKAIRKKPSKIFKSLELLELKIKNPSIHIDNINPNKLSIRKFDLSLEGYLYFTGNIDVRLKMVLKYINKTIYIKLNIFEVYGKFFYLQQLSKNGFSKLSFMDAPYLKMKVKF